MCRHCAWSFPSWNLTELHEFNHALVGIESLARDLDQLALQCKCEVRNLDDGHEHEVVDPDDVV
jgi:hypothetical protein